MALDTHAAIKSGSVYFVVDIDNIPKAVTVLGRGDLTKCANLAENTAMTDALLCGLGAYVSLLGQNAWKIVEADWK